MYKKIPNKINNAIQEFVTKVNEMFGNRTKKIILYGSYARGDYNKSSDIDIMILTDLSDKEIVYYSEKIWEFAYDIELENDVIISPLIKNIDRFNYWLEVLYNEKLYKSANNRAYYAIFHAIRSVFALEPIDFKKHKDVIGYFNKNYVNT